MGLILDTSAIVAWERAIGAGRALGMDPGEELALPAIVWAEALSGVRLADTAQRAAQRLARLEAIRHVTGVEPRETITDYEGRFAQSSTSLVVRYRSPQSRPKNLTHLQRPLVF